MGSCIKLDFLIIDCFERMKPYLVFKMGSASMLTPRFLCLVLTGWIILMPWNLQRLISITFST